MLMMTVLWFRTCAAVLLVGLALLFIAACGGPLPPERSLTVTATEMRFTPDVLTARVGEQVFIRFKNEGQVAHNLVVALPFGDRRISAEAGVDAILVFPAREAGTFRFYCDIPGHEEQVGTLIIEP